MDIYDKILGGLFGAALGDAMGAATETRSRTQIAEKFGGPVTTLLTPPDDVFAAGFPAGSVTDDFSLAYYTAMAIITHNGIVDADTATDALVNWSHSKYYRLAGPTTVGAVKRLLGEEMPAPVFKIAVDNGKGTNGSAMKISPVGLASGGDIEKAIIDAITICLPTHNNSTSLSAACAVSRAVSATLHEDATLDSITDCAIHGAQLGNEIGVLNGVELACPSVHKRIALAKSIALTSNSDMDTAMTELCDIIGSGLAAAEAVPTAIGLVIAADGDPVKAIIGGVNIGNDTDTVATIAGAIAGAYKGFNSFGKYCDYLETINSVNGFNLEIVAKRLCEIAENNRLNLK